MYPSVSVLLEESPKTGSTHHKFFTLQFINPLINKKKIIFVKINISNYQKLNNYINKFNPQIIINFAAESHVDNSIKSPNIFFKSNVSGVYNILLSIKNYNCSFCIIIKIRLFFIKCLNMSCMIILLLYFK